MPRAFLIKNKVKCGNGGVAGGSCAGEVQLEGGEIGTGGETPYRKDQLSPINPGGDVRGEMKLEGNEEKTRPDTRRGPSSEGLGGGRQLQRPHITPSNLYLPTLEAGLPSTPDTPVHSAGSTSPPTPPSPFRAPRASPPGAAPFHTPGAAPRPSLRLQMPSQHQQHKSGSADISWDGARKFDGLGMRFSAGAVPGAGGGPPFLPPTPPLIEDAKKNIGVVGTMANGGVDPARFNLMSFHQHHRHLLMDALCNRQQMHPTYGAIKSLPGSYSDQVAMLRSEANGISVPAAVSTCKLPFSNHPNMEKWGQQVMPHKPQVYRPIPAHPVVDIFNPGGAATPPPAVSMFPGAHSLSGLPSKSPSWRNHMTLNNLVTYTSSQRQQQQQLQPGPKTLLSVSDTKPKSPSTGVFSISNFVSKTSDSSEKSGESKKDAHGNSYASDQLTRFKRENVSHEKSGEKSTNPTEGSVLCRPWNTASASEQPEGQTRGRDPVNFLGIDFSQEHAPRRTMNPPRYQCEACNKSYATFSGLSKHKQFHCVSQIKKQFSCKYCEKNYVSLGALKMHIRTHTLPCKCHLCGKAFSRPWLLQGHVRTHTGEKPFQCSHCGRSFADRSNLRAHLQTHTDVKKYNCRNCSKTFSRMSLLLKHQDGGCPGGSV